MKKLIIFCSVISLFSCTRAEKESTTVTLNLPSHWSQESTSISTKGDLSSQSLNSSIVPSSLSELNCFIALVGGPDKNLSNNICKYKNSADTFSIGLLFSGFVNNGAAGTQMKFEVPTGSDRAIYLVGFKIPEAPLVAVGSSVASLCAALPNVHGMDTYLSEPYLIASSKGLKLSGDDLELNMTAALNTSNKIGDCKGPLFQDSGDDSSNSGVPYKFAITFQDEVGSNAHPLGPDKCVGVRFQVQDVNGNRASMPATTNIVGRVGMNYLGSAIGTFYHTGSAIGCTPGSEMSSGSSDMTVSFTNAGTAFSDFVAFFSPSSAQGASGNIQIQNFGSISSDGSTAISMQPGSANFVYGTSTPPVKYAIYDLFNNRSTNSTSSGSPMVIRYNECRQGFLQFLDVNGVPTRLNLSTGPYKNVEINPVGTTSNLNFFASSSDCSINNSPFTSVNVPMSPYSSHAMHKYFYKMAIPLTTFSFSALNVAGSSTPAISSGDMNSSSNYWRSENN